MRSLFVILVLWLGFDAQPAMTEPLPGANDPLLREAALAWLAEDDPEGALWAIGELAADGNIAARYFINGVYYGISNGEKRLSRQEFFKLIPEDRDPNAGGFAPYPIDYSNIPALDALSEIMQARAADEWIAHADVAIAAGMQSHLLPQLETILSNNDAMNIEIAGFVQVRLSGDPYFDLLLTTFLGQQFITLGALAEAAPEIVAERRARWANGPLPRDLPDAFFEALSAQDWVAMFIEGSQRRWAKQVGIDRPLIDASLVDDDVRRLADIVSAGAVATLREMLPPTASEFEALAQSYARHAARFPSARPNWTLCEQYCPDQPATCAVQAGLLGDLAFSGTVDFTPILSRREYYQSERAVRAQLAVLGSIAFPVEFKPDWLALPQCLREPAREAYAKQW